MLQNKSGFWFDSGKWKEEDKLYVSLCKGVCSNYFLCILGELNQEEKVLAGYLPPPGQCSAERHFLEKSKHTSDN